MCTIITMPRTRRYSNEELAAAVAANRTWFGVSRALGLRAGGGTYRTLRRAIAEAGIDAPHLTTSAGGAPTRRRWTEDELRTAVATSTTVAGVARRLGYRPSGGIHRMLQAAIRMRELDTSHFTGQGWAAGRSFSRPRRPLEEILVQRSSYPPSNLRRRLIAAGLKDGRCEGCGIDEWQGEPLSLHLDHVNGDPLDNRLENLRILCPNCHALTDTWCGRNRRRSPIGRRHRDDRTHVRSADVRSSAP